MPLSPLTRYNTRARAPDTATRLHGCSAAPVLIWGEVWGSAPLSVLLIRQDRDNLPSCCSKSRKQMYHHKNSPKLMSDLLRVGREAHLVNSSAWCYKTRVELWCPAHCSGGEGHGGGGSCWPHTPFWKWQISHFQPTPTMIAPCSAHAYKLLDCSHIHQQHSTASADNQKKAPVQW